MNNIRVRTTVTITGGNDVIGTKEKTLYYLVFENNLDGEKVIINIGEGTFVKVNKLLEDAKTR